MARVIPNQNTWIGFVPWPGEIENLCAPTGDELAMAQDLTCLTMSINASSTGNTVPTPSLCSLFETTINGTVTATFQADFYRDNEDDLAWNLLKRGVCGYFIIKRFGGTDESCDPSDNAASTPPAGGDPIEVWPVKITSRTAGALSSGTVMMFSVTAAVTEIPCEDAVAYGSGGQLNPGYDQAALPSAPRDVTASVLNQAAGEVNLVWRIPEENATSVTNYIVKGSRDGGVFEDIERVGNTLTHHLEDLDAGDWVFKVAAVNVAGTGPSSAVSNEVTVA